jgi:glycerol kinase
VFICGAAIQWLRDCLGILQNAAESETLAATVKNTGGVYFVPAFVGLGAPYWDPYARGAIFGITRGTTKAHITRATLEAMAFQTVDVLDVMQKEVGLSLSALRVDGGASANNILLSLQSDFLGVPVIRSACLETTALGAALLAGLATGCFASVKHIQDLIKEGKCYTPRMSAQNREQSLAGWHSAIKRTLGKL